MKKVLEYNLKVNIDENFPQMPVLHDYKVDEIKIENNSLIITSVDLANHDDDSFISAGFHAKKVQAEFIFDDFVDCNVTVFKFFPKKQIKEKNKYGYGKRSNCYDIQEFLVSYKDYNLEILYNMVGYNQVNLVLAGRYRQEIEMQIFCDRVKYTFV